MPARPKAQMVSLVARRVELLETVAVAARVPKVAKLWFARQTSAMMPRFTLRLKGHAPHLVR